MVSIYNRVIRGSLLLLRRLGKHPACQADHFRRRSRKLTIMSIKVANLLSTAVLILNRDVPTLLLQPR